MTDISPEDWEAKDHIEFLKKGLGKEGTCDYHDDIVRAQMWLIRRTDMTHKAVTNGGLRPIRDAKEFMYQFMYRSPYAAALVVCVGMVIYSKYKGWLT